jgi:prolyl-tRNA synthetase
MGEKGSTIRIEIGERDLKKNVVTMVRRDTNERSEVSIDV